MTLSRLWVFRHLGHNAPYSPTYRGFKSWLGLPYSGDMGCLDSAPQGCKASYSRTKGQPACPALCAANGAAQQHDDPYLRDPFVRYACARCSTLQSAPLLCSTTNTRPTAHLHLHLSRYDGYSQMQLQQAGDGPTARDNHVNTTAIPLFFSASPNCSAGAPLGAQINIPAWVRLYERSVLTSSSG